MCRVDAPLSRRSQHPRLPDATALPQAWRYLAIPEVQFASGATPSGARILTGCTSKIGAEAVGAHPFEGGLPRTRSNNQLPPQRCYRTFNRAQTDDDVLLSRQFLAYLICVARVETKTLTQPVRQVIELFRPRRRSIRTPLTSRQPVTRRPRRTAELDGNSLRPPSCGLQPQHGRDIARGLHRVPSAVRSVLLAYSRAKLRGTKTPIKR